MSFLEFLVFGVCSVYSQIGECRPAVVNGLLSDVESLVLSAMTMASDTELVASKVVANLINGLPDEVVYKMTNVAHM